MVKAAEAAKADAVDLGVKVTLARIKPPIWRRLAVLDTMTLHQLHRAIQVAMGWDESHLHQFSIGNVTYADPAHDLDGCSDERRVTLRKLVASGARRFTYTYDFGDTWDHNILIEKAKPKTTWAGRPRLVAGARQCPPEDCGGIWGYAQFIEAMADPAHPNHAEQREWHGEDFDPEAFSVEETDSRLARLFARND